MLFLSLIAFSAAVSAHAGHGHGHHDPYAMFAKIKRASPTDEASAAKSTNPAQECKPYSNPTVSAIASSYPANWQIATIPNSDSEAQALFKALEPTIPNIAVKGTPQGDFSAFTPTYDSSDPDCWWTYKQCTKGKTAGVIGDITTCQEPDTWGLTYDDGPNCSHNAFYDYLRDQNQKATMFFIGSNVMNWPLEAQRALVDGHEICAHTWSHRYMTGLTNEQAFAELYYAKKIIKEVIGITTNCWRPAFGDVDDRIRYIAQALGMQTITWVRDVFDWNWPVLGLDTIDANYQGLIDASANGTFSTYGPIVLSHEIDGETMEKAIEWLPKVKAAFKAVVPVGACHNVTHPYVETDYVYPDYAEYVSGTTQLDSPGISEASIDSLSIPLEKDTTASITSALYTPDSTAQPTAAASSSSTGSSAKATKTGAGAQAAIESSSATATASNTSGAPSLVPSLLTFMLAVAAFVAF